MRYYIAKEITTKEGEQKTMYYSAGRFNILPEDFEVVPVTEGYASAYSAEPLDEPPFGDSFTFDRDENWENLFFDEDFGKATIFISLEHAQRVTVTSQDS